MENENKRIIEVNGVKMEIDLRQAKVIDNYNGWQYETVAL